MNSAKSLFLALCVSACLMLPTLASATAAPTSATAAVC